MERINLKFWSKKEIDALCPCRFVQREIGEDVMDGLKRGRVILLYGPRRSGKTSLVGWIVKRLLREGVKPEKINYASMDYLDLHSLFYDTRRLIGLIEDIGGNNSFLFIDEVQRLENAGLILKRIYDSHKGIRVIATGSSIIDIRASVKESLAGRKDEYILYPFSFREYLRALSYIPDKRLTLYNYEELVDFNNLYGDGLNKRWNEFIHYGGYPEVTFAESKKEKEKFLAGLYSSVVEKDIIELLSSGKRKGLLDFMNILAFETGRIYERASLARNIGKDIRTIREYEDLAIETFLLYRLNPFHTQKRKEIRKAPKFYWYDMGLLNFISGDIKKDRVESGFVLENSVLMEIKKHPGLGEWEVYFWKSKGGGEVDFVIKYGKEIVPIEVKAGRVSSPTRALLSFIQRFSTKTAIMVCGTLKREKRKETEIIYLPPYLFPFFKTENVQS